MLRLHFVEVRQDGKNVRHPAAENMLLDERPLGQAHRHAGVEDDDGRVRHADGVDHLLEGLRCEVARSRCVEQLNAELPQPSIRHSDINPRQLRGIRTAFAP